MRRIFRELHISRKCGEVSPVCVPHLGPNRRPITVQLGIGLDVVGVYC